MKQLLIVFFGGGVGSICRYWISKHISHHFETSFPLGTLAVNILGCFLIGIILAIIERYRWHPASTLLLATGFCGGFTTFSSFAYENILLLNQENYGAFIIYTISSLILGFLATFLGLILIKNL